MATVKTPLQGRALADHDAKIQMEKWHLSTVSGAICGILSVASLNFLHMVAHVH